MKEPIRPDVTGMTREQKMEVVGKYLGELAKHNEWMSFKHDMDLAVMKTELKSNMKRSCKHNDNGRCVVDGDTCKPTTECKWEGR